jgi:hypothetical protein
MGTTSVFLSKKCNHSFKEEIKYPKNTGARLVIDYVPDYSTPYMDAIETISTPTDNPTEIIVMSQKLGKVVWEGTFAQLIEKLSE